jgi:hypothetical protein
MRNEVSVMSKKLEKKREETNGKFKRKFLSP